VAKISELEVFNKLRYSLDASRVRVVQLVPPGGQAPLSVSFRGQEGVRRTVFPDMISYADQNIFIGELKPTYSKADADKLLCIKNSPDGRNAILELVARVARLPSLRSARIHFVLVHAGSLAAIPLGLRQVRFSNNKGVWVDATLTTEELVFSNLVQTAGF